MADDAQIWVPSFQHDIEIAYADDFPAFAHDILGVKLWDKAEELLWSIQANKNTACIGCFESGKTFIVAAACLAFVYTRPYSKGITTAPTGRQVKDQLWGEIRALYGEAKVELGGECLIQHLKIGVNWFLTGFKASDYNEEAMQGYHSPTGVIYAADEATGLAQTILDARDKIVVNPYDRFVAVGNPTDPTAPFKAMFSDPTFYKIRIQDEDVPNVKENRIVIAGLLRREFVEEKRKAWGENSPLFQARLKACWPETSIESVFPMAWVEAAMIRWEEREELWSLGEWQPTGRKCVGVDVARFGDDMTCLIRRIGSHFLAPLETFNGLDTKQVATRAIFASRAGFYPAIDVIGIGAGVVDECRHACVNVRPVNFGEGSDRFDATGILQFLNKRAELHWRLRELLDPACADPISLPPDPLLKEELCIIKWKEAGKGKIKIESKDEIKKRLGRSPDRSDACVLTMDVPEPIASLVALLRQMDSGDGDFLRADYTLRDEETLAIQKEE